MTIKHIDKTYSQNTLQWVLSDYAQTVENETGGEFIQVSSVQVYIDGGDPEFFNHLFTDLENPVEVMVDDFRSVIEPNYSQDWVITIVTTVKFD